MEIHGKVIDFIAFGENYKCSFRHLSCLILLETKGDLNVKQIMELLDVSYSWASLSQDRPQGIARLIDGGFVRVYQLEGQGKYGNTINKYSITEKGKTLLDSNQILYKPKTK